MISTRWTVPAAAALIATATAAAAQTDPTPSPQILVSATGMVRTAPDMVTLGFTVRGEGATSDEATAKVRDIGGTIRSGTASLVGNPQGYRASTFAITAVRARECDANNWGQQRLSTGACAIVGYVATLPVTIETARIADAGTLVGLIGRLGGMDVGIRRFWLRDDAAAQKAATQAALASAERQAKLIAEGSGGRLGNLIRVQDADYREPSPEKAEDVVLTRVAAPAPPPPPPPVAISLAPEPIVTTVRLMAAYAIVR